MNGKRSKALRSQARSYNVGERWVQYALKEHNRQRYNKGGKPVQVICQQLVLSPHCGRAVYQRLKRQRTAAP